METIRFNATCQLTSLFPIKQRTKANSALCNIFQLSLQTTSFSVFFCLCGGDFSASQMYCTVHYRNRCSKCPASAWTCLRATSNYAPAAEEMCTVLAVLSCTTSCPASTCIRHGRAWFRSDYDAQFQTHVGKAVPHPDITGYSLDAISKQKPHTKGTAANLVLVNLGISVVATLLVTGNTARDW
jgi:hypothetical protein